MYGHVNSRDCECGEGIEDWQHYLLKCSTYIEERKILFSEIEKIWNNSRRSGNLKMDVNLVLGGTNGKGKLNHKKEVLETF